MVSPPATDSTTTLTFAGKGPAGVWYWGTVPDTWLLLWNTTSQPTGAVPVCDPPNLTRWPPMKFTPLRRNVVPPHAGDVVALEAS